MSLSTQTIGWVGAGRMGTVLASRLLRAGFGLAVWNRTREKTAALADAGARIVDAPADLADLDIVVTIVADSQAYEDVALADGGLLSRDDAAPRVIIDSSTISVDASERVREAAAQRGCAVVAAPVSGNPKAALAGRLTVVASGPRDTFEQVQPLLAALGQHVTYVGERDAARLVKICHNLLLGVTAQMMAETAVLAERGGVSRAAYLDFLNHSVMGSVFTRYKTPAYVTLDYTPTFTSHLLRKDFELGLAAARELDVTLPVSALAHQLIVQLSNSEHADGDFAALLGQAARAAGMQLAAEDGPVDDGLAPVADPGTDRPASHDGRPATPTTGADENPGRQARPEAPAGLATSIHESASDRVRDHRNRRR